MPLGTTGSSTPSYLLSRTHLPVEPMPSPSTGTSGIPFTFFLRCLSSHRWSPGCATLQAGGPLWLLFTPSRHGSRTSFTGPGIISHFPSTLFPSSLGQGGFSTPTHPFIAFTCGDYEVGSLLQGHVPRCCGYDLPGSQSYYHTAVPRYLVQVLLFSFLLRYSS